MASSSLPGRPVVDADMVRKVAALARLEVSPEELAVLTGQLARIIGYIDQIREIPLDVPSECEPPSATPVRPDVPAPGNGLEALQRNQAFSVHGYGVVPRVVGGEE